MQALVDAKVSNEILLDKIANEVVPENEQKQALDRIKDNSLIK